jgi:Protein of unknown function (DUF2628)
LVAYTVYEPRNPASDPTERAAGLIFIKDGFLWLAAIFPAVWLLVKGLWLELVAFVVIVAIVAGSGELLGPAPMVDGLLLVIVQIIFGFEAGAIQGAAIERRGGRFLGSVTGRTRAECERRFYTDWLPDEPDVSALPADSEPTARGPVATWTETAWQGAKDTIARGRRPTGAKA